MSGLLLAARRNMSAVYVDIARAFGEVEIVESSFGWMCRSSFAHPIGNFAISDSMDEAVRSQIAEFAERQPMFQVYAFSKSDSDDAKDRSGLDSGFRRTGRLTTMVSHAPRLSERASTVELRLDSTPEDRRESATQIVQTFFRRAEPSHREAVLRSTSRSSVDLYSILENGRRSGVVMVHEDEHSLGIYNFCVVPERQGKGVGTQVVHRVLAMAAESGKAVVLQCDSGLVDWYDRLGFKEIEAVEVWNLAKSAGVAIMT